MISMKSTFTSKKYIQSDINNIFSESYYQDQINRKYLGLANLFEEHFMDLDSSRFQFFIFIFFLVGLLFFSFLLSYICLTTYLEFNPQNFTVGIYNYDAPFNYYFNPFYLSALIVLFFISLLLLFTQVVLTFDLRKAKLTDSILNQGISFVKTDQNSQLSNSELRALFIANNSASIKIGFTDVVLMFGFIALFVLSVFMWFLLKN